MSRHKIPPEPWKSFLDSVDRTLTEAVESAIAVEMDFDLQTALQRFIGSGLLRRALCPNGEDHA